MQLSPTCICSRTFTTYLHLSWFKLNCSLAYWDCSLLCWGLTPISCCWSLCCGFTEAVWTILIIGCTTSLRWVPCQTRSFRLSLRIFKFVNKLIHLWYIYLAGIILIKNFEYWMVFRLVKIKIIRCHCAFMLYIFVLLVI